MELSLIDWIVPGLFLFQDYSRIKIYLCYNWCVMGSGWLLPLPGLDGQIRIVLIWFSLDRRHASLVRQVDMPAL